MNVDDIPGLEAIQPTSVVTYLRTHGWTQAGMRLGGDEAIYKLTPERGGPLTAGVVLDDSYSDFRLRMAELVDAISRVERRPMLEVLNDILAPSGDQVRFRIRSDRTESGTIGLDQSISLRTGLKNLVLSAAHAAIAPQAHFPRMTQAKALDLVDRCRERQSERGSYVASLVIPVVPPVGQLLLQEEFGRQTSRKLFTALDTAARSAANPEILTTSVAEGVSSNLLDALAKMGPEGERSSVEVSVHWLDGPPSGEFARVLKIPGGAFQHFRPAAQALREASPMPNTEVVGYVIALKKSPDAPRGVATVTTTLESFGPTRVHLELQSPDYEKAAEAHLNGSRVRVVGTLKKSGRSLELDQSTRLELLPDEE